MTQKRRLPNGRVVVLDIIEHPGAVLIIPFLSKQKMIFLYQYRPAVKKYLFELPAGTINKSEKPLDCARRELVEETNFRAGKMTLLGKIYPVPGYSTEVIFIFKAEHLSPCDGVKDHEEIIKTQVFPKSRIKKMFSQGKIVDAKTISALAFCRWLP